MVSHPKPERTEALSKLAAFVPAAGRSYSASRNFDYGPGQRNNISTLSPYIRHRLLTESEVVQAVLRTHTSAAAAKFIQEVCWRTYWKGWLEHRPCVWSCYLDELAAQQELLREDTGLAAAIAAATQGKTGIACFDGWAQELVETGYLHNHARMWFASIWIFTLRLPWVLGADYFLRQLLDGDPASNTLSWRWVGGLHTVGKTYLARADNIAKYTGFRFEPAHDDLASFASPLVEKVEFARVALRAPARLGQRMPVVLLVTEEDLTPESWPLDGANVCGIAIFSVDCIEAAYVDRVRAFKSGALVDAGERAARHWDMAVAQISEPAALLSFAQTCGASAIVTSTVPVGYVRPQIDECAAACFESGVPLLELSRRWDSLFWPHATGGFFQLKARIPSVVAELDLEPQATLF